MRSWSAWRFLVHSGIKYPMPRMSDEIDLLKLLEADFQNVMRRPSCTLQQRFEFLAHFVDFPKCEHVAARTLALPFHPKLTEHHVDEVCKKLKSLL